MSRMGNPRQEPVFNAFRRKLYRPFFSLWEFWIGIGLLVVVAGVVAWVMWRGQHPEPGLFQVGEKFLSNKGKNIAVYKRPLQPWVEPGAASMSVKSYAPFPDSVTADGWQAPGGVQEFGVSNLYEKIDGREAFYKTYGFDRLYCLSLTKQELTIDIELFDLSTIENALGAFSAEITSPETQITPAPGGFSYTSRNAGFVAHGRFYARLLGSDDNETIRAKVQNLMQALVASLPGGKVPWAYEVFAGRMKFSPRQVQYYARDAFSFGFADEIYAAKIKDDTEVFFSQRKDATAAAALAGKFVEALAGFGKKLDSPAGVTVLRNDFANTFDAIGTEGEFVIGVHMAVSAEEALRWFGLLHDQLKATPKAETTGEEH
jgi:hypothetical protein